MGWGYEYLWSWRLPLNGHSMGIVDAVAVKHDMRALGLHYSVDIALDDQVRLLKLHPHRPPDESHIVLRMIHARNIEDL